MDIKYIDISSYHGYYELDSLLQNTDDKILEGFNQVLHSKIFPVFKNIHNFKKIFLIIDEFKNQDYIMNKSFVFYQFFSTFTIKNFFRKILEILYSIFIKKNKLIIDKDILKEDLKFYPRFDERNINIISNIEETDLIILIKIISNIQKIIILSKKEIIKNNPSNKDDLLNLFDNLSKEIPEIYKHILRLKDEIKNIILFIDYQHKQIDSKIDIDQKAILNGFILSIKKNILQKYYERIVE